MTRRAETLTTTGVAALVAGIILGPMLQAGFPLRYDLVSVPRPVLGDDALGLGDRLPRAIPLDAATAVLAKLLPDAWLTQLLALLALTLAGTGVARLLDVPLPGRLAAVVAVQWNPFVLEQLSIGHVPHLLGYGAAPWAGWAGWCLVSSRLPGRVAWRPARPAPFYWAVLVLASVAGSLTAGGGLLVALAALAGLIAGARARPEPAGWFSNQTPDARFRHGSPRPAWMFVLAGLVPVALLQLPWLVAAVMAPGLSGGGTGPDAGLTAFALRSETGWGRLVDALGLAGMWNEVALPSSRGTVLAPVSVVLVVGLALGGVPHLRSRVRSHPWLRPAVAAAGLACALSYLIAVLPVLPGGAAVLSALVDAVPGAGLLRDGHRWLALPALGFAVLAGHAVAGAGAAIGDRLSPGREPPDAPTRVVHYLPAEPIALHPVARVWRWTTAGLVAVLLVASMPDLALGLGGRLRAWDYPAQWAGVRAELDAAPDSARVLVLPWQPFRQFGWSGRSAVLDPAPRLLPRQTIVSDALTVSGRTLPAEGPGARAINADLADGVLTDAELRSWSIGWVLVEKGTPGAAIALPAGWTQLADGSDLRLWRSPAPMPAAPAPAPARAVAVIGAHLVYAGLAALALALFTAIASGWAMRRKPAYVTIGDRRTVR